MTLPFFAQFLMTPYMQEFSPTENNCSRVGLNHVRCRRFVKSASNYAFPRPGAPFGPRTGTIQNGQPPWIRAGSQESGLGRQCFPLRPRGLDALLAVSCTILSCR